LRQGPAAVLEHYHSRLAREIDNRDRLTETRKREKMEGSEYRQRCEGEERGELSVKEGGIVNCVLYPTSKRMDEADTILYVPQLVRRNLPAVGQASACPYVQGVEW
jgi:hypothetical protein